MFKSIVLAASLAAAALAQAQTPNAAAAGKKELVARVVQLQQGGIEQFASSVAAGPAMQLQQRAAIALQGLPAERREAVGREIDADLRKYIEETAPILRERAAKVAPGVIGPMLDERFSEDELRQVIAMLDSPVIRKYMAMSQEIQRALGEKLVAETRAEVEPKVHTLEQAIGRRLGVTPTNGVAAPKAPASAAKK